MAYRTELVCICEGEEGRSIDPVFINRLMRKLKPAWVRKPGSNFIRLIPCRGRIQLLEEFPRELNACIHTGGHSTLMVWADVDDDCKDPDELRKRFWKVAEEKGITREQFENVLFVFARDRLENWVEFLATGSTDEDREGPRVKNNREVRNAADKLAERCRNNIADPKLPPSLEWSCRNWRNLADKMKSPS